MYISEKMKGVSAVIATIMMLVITIGLAGVAYMYISGIFTTQTAKLVAIDQDATFCSGTSITIYIKKTGTQAFKKSTVNIGIQGGTFTLCNQGGTDGDVPAGGTPVACDYKVTGVAGFNTVLVNGIVGGPTNSAKTSVSC